MLKFLKLIAEFSNEKFKSVDLLENSINSIEYISDVRMDLFLQIVLEVVRPIP